MMPDDHGSGSGDDADTLDRGAGDARRSVAVTEPLPLAAPAIVDFQGVAKSFKTSDAELRVVSDINLAVAPGEIVTLVGPSGCGKSTLLNMTAGLLQPTAGTVLYRGRPIVGLNLNVGYMTQTDHLLPWRTVAQNVMAPLEIRRVPRKQAAERVAALLDRVGLSNFAASYPSQISGGMRKRTALARLLACDTEILLMDEPFGALDAQLRLTLQIELRDLCRRLDKTVLFVTHDVDEAIALGDRCVVFSALPGTIRATLTVPLPVERDIARLRGDEHYIRTCAGLWNLLVPEIGLPGGAP
jgi:NitT/TauT family transport system ATP-binding protein